jgi:hypothetical protein
MFQFDEKHSYPYNTILKQFEGKFNPETKTWSLPLKHKSRFLSAKQTIDIASKEKSQLVWSKACDAVGVKFAKKGTNEYDQVLEVFKQMIKE